MISPLMYTRRWHRIVYIPGKREKIRKDTEVTRVFIAEHNIPTRAQEIQEKCRQEGAIILGNEIGPRIGIDPTDTTRVLGMSDTSLKLMDI